MSFEIDPNSRYRKSHEWARAEGDVVLCGITKYSEILQTSLPVYVMLPTVGQKLSTGESYAIIETDDAVGDVFSPLSGIIAAINDKLETSPQIIANDPFGKGWLIKLIHSDTSEIDSLMDAEAYKNWLCIVDASRKAWSHDYTTSPEELIGLIIGWHKIESVEGIGAESVVCNLLNLDTDMIDQVLKIPRSNFRLSRW